MHMLERRLQILIDERRYRRVAAAARERNSSVAAVIRDAIDLALPGDASKKRAAAQALLEAEPIAVPDVARLKAELDERRAGST